MYNPPEIERHGCFCKVPSPVFDSTTSFDVCSKCGVVMEMILDEAPEYEFDVRGNYIGHYGMADASLGTMIDREHKLTKRLQASLAEQSDLIACEIRNIAAQICHAVHIRVPHIIYDTAVEIANLHREKVYLSGGKKTASIAMSVFFACKLHNSDREIRLFSTACCIDMKLLNFAIKSIKENLKDTKYMIVVNSENKYYALITQFADRLYITNEEIKSLRRDSNNMIEKMTDIFDTGRKPRTVIASILYICALKNNLNIDMRDVSIASNVCAQSIGKCVSFIKKEYRIDF